MKIIKFDKDGKVIKPNKKDMFNILLNKLGYALLALFILSFFIYVILPFLNVSLTLFQSLCVVSMIAVIRNYWTTTGKSFLILSAGYPVVLLIVYGMMLYAK